MFEYEQKCGMILKNLSVKENQCLQHASLDNLVT